MRKNRKGAMILCILCWLQVWYFVDPNCEGSLAQCGRTVCLHLEEGTAGVCACFVWCCVVVLCGVVWLFCVVLCVCFVWCCVFVLCGAVCLFLAKCQWYLLQGCLKM